jgi:hypothetical protein
MKLPPQASAVGRVLWDHGSQAEGRGLLPAGCPLGYFLCQEDPHCPSPMCCPSSTACECDANAGRWICGSS